MDINYNSELFQRRKRLVEIMKKRINLFLERNLLNFINFLKNNLGIILVLLLSFILHVFSWFQLGIRYNLNSDDLSYIASGVHFAETGQIIMHGVVSAQSMPGMAYIVASVASIFGTGIQMWFCLKVIWMIFGLLSIFGFYKTINLFGKKRFALLMSLLLLLPDFIWMDNLILTETPFMMAFIFIIYYSFKLEKTHDKKYFYAIIFFYMFGVLLKANFAIYPLFLIVYLLIKKYDYKVLIKQILISGCIISCFFVPWSIRNYILFDRFIPLTYGSGNPLLLGTYQGIGYPADNKDDYLAYANGVMSEEMKSFIYGTNTDESKGYMSSYYRLEYDGIIARYRMNRWWREDKIEMLKSYLLYKPKIIVYNSFYWDSIFNISKKDIMIFRFLDIILCGMLGLYLMYQKNFVVETLFLGFNYIFQVYVYSYTFAFDRYGQTLIFLRLLVIGIGLSVLYDNIKKKKLLEMMNKLYIGRLDKH